MSEHLTRRELHSPDKFQSQATGLMQWAHEHPREVTFMGVGLLVVIALTGVIFGGGMTRSSPGAAELTTALAIAERPVKATPDEKPEPGEDPPFASAKEKNEALLKALSDVREKHPGSDAAQQALLPMAGAELALGKTDDALKSYDEYLTKAPVGAPLRFLAYQGKGELQLAKNDFAGAQANFEAMAKELPGYGDYAALGKARALDGQGKFADAYRGYEEVKSWKGGSSLSSDAGTRESALTAAHPEIPAQVAAAEKPAVPTPADAKPAAAAKP